MNDTKGASETSVVAGDKQQQAKNKQNIREIYLNAVKNNKGTQLKKLYLIFFICQNIKTTATN